MSEVRKMSNEASLSTANHAEWTNGDPSLLDRFWVHMGGRYGKPWFERYGRDMPEAWKDSLLTMTPDEARAGLRQLRRREDIYGLPTLTDFEQSVLQALAASKPRSETHKALPEPAGERKRRATKASEHVAVLQERIGTPPRDRVKDVSGPGSLEPMTESPEIFERELKERGMR